MTASLDFSSYDALRTGSEAIADALAMELADHGIVNRETMCAGREDLIGHVNAYAASVLTYSLPLWLHHLEWAKACMIEHGLHSDDVEQVFRLLRSKVFEHAGNRASCEIFDLGLKALPTLPEHVSCSLDSHVPWHRTAQEMLDRMLEFDKPAAVRVIASVNLPLPELYMNVIGPAMHRLGELWQSAKISPAQEHFCTSLTTEIMAELRGADVPRPDGRRMIAAAVSGERHELGIRMVADLFEYHGWVSLYLGADVPTDSLVSAAVDYEAELVAVSVSMTARLPELRRIADKLREQRPSVRLLVGGLPLQLAPDLYKSLGADATATTPEAALQTARQLLLVNTQ